jgi:ribosomal protein S12 methylthiotransferase
LVDSEALLGHFLDRGYTLAATAEAADVCILNSCGFIDAARQDSLAALKDLARRKRPGQRLVVVGCWSQQHAAGIRRQFPAVDLVAGVGGFGEIVSALERTEPASLIGAPERVPYEGYQGRPLLTPPHVAFVKIGEGCSCHCTFCRIPAIRGALRSRPIAQVVGEAQDLVARGVREIQLVAQNIGDYGRDSGEDLLSLVRQLGEIAHLRRLRILYLYAGLVPWQKALALLECRNVVPYLDIPIQHASPRLLRAMKRPGDPHAVLDFCLQLRRRRPDLVLRTTVLLGFPGEQEEDLEQLADLLARVEFDHLGTYRYSPEDGTPAAELPDRVPAEEVADREARILDLQAEIALRRQERRLGQTYELVVDSISQATQVADILASLQDGSWYAGALRGRLLAHLSGESMVALGRSYHYGYDLDGVVVLPGGGLQAGDWCVCRFGGVTPFDTWAEVCQDSAG